MNTRAIPETDFTYKELESALTTVYLALEPLKGGDKKDERNFRKAVSLLNGFAARNSVRRPQEVAEDPRLVVGADLGHPNPSLPCRSLGDLLVSFQRDYKVLKTAKDKSDWEILRTVVLSVFHRHGVLTAAFKKEGRLKVPYAVEQWNPQQEFKTLRDIIGPPRPAKPQRVPPPPQDQEDPTAPE